MNSMNETQRTEEISGRNVKMKSMYVTGCARLNVRKDPDPDADILKVLNFDERVLVFPEFDNPNYYQIRVDAKTKGYVVKKHLKDRF